MPSTLKYQNREYDDFNTTYKVDSLQYPEDLTGANNTYGSNYVIFYINTQEDSRVNMDKAMSYSETVDPSKVGNTAGRKSDIQNQDISKTEATAKTGLGTAGIAGLASLISTGNPAKATGVAVLAGGTAAITTGVVMSQSAGANRPTKRLRAAIALHNPNLITNRYTTDWSASETAKEQMAMLNFGGSDSSGSILDLVKNASGGALGAATNLALSLAPNKDSLSGMSGMAANGKKEMLFRGVDQRSFTFDYMFSPRSREEYGNVKDIIKMFKFHMHPEYQENSGNYIFLYPSEFDILYYNNGSENENLSRYTSCVLGEMVVNYTPNGNFNAFEGGIPTQINMTLTFRELSILTKAEIGDGY